MKKISLIYQPQIDGLRAIAVIGVILFHMNYQWITGGFVGVDIFFVISGYLITSIILKEHESGLFKISKFMIRRIKRVLPALLIMLIVISIVTYFLLFVDDINSFGEQSLSAIFSCSNIFFWKTAGSYWGTSANNLSLLHIWSLSLEEQFYLVYPFILIFFLSFKKKYVFFSILAIALCSFFLYLYCSSLATFYLLPMRAWEISSGCLAAIILRNRQVLYSCKTIQTLTIICIIFIIIFFFKSSEGARLYVIATVICSVFLVVFGQNQNLIVNTILSSSILVNIGKLSYSLYLWHWPVIVIAEKLKIVHKFEISKLFLIVIIVIASVFSYNLIEKPIRKSDKGLKIILICFIVCLIVSFLLYKSNKYDGSIYNKTYWYGDMYNNNPRMDTSIWHKMKGIAVPRRDVAYDKAFENSGIIKYYGGEKPDIVVLGDSHALMWSCVIDSISKDLGLTVCFYAADGTSPFIELPIKKYSCSWKYMSSEEKFIFEKKKIENLNNWKPRIVIIVTRWTWLSEEKVTADLLEFIGKLGSKILFIEEPPTLYFGPQNTPKYLDFLHMIPKEGLKQFVKITNYNKYQIGKNLMRSIANKYVFCDTISVSDFFLKNSSEALVLDGFKVLYIDDNHLSYDGAMSLKDKIQDKIKKIIQPMP